MMVMTAKVDIKKILIALGIIAAAIIALILIFGNGGSTQTAAPISDNDSRVEFLAGKGWDVSASPVESGQVRIPEEPSEVFQRYNQLQKQQGYDLSTYAGKNVMRYVYKVENFPDATEPVYATVLVYKNQIIGGDITDTSAGGKVQGIKPVKKSSEQAAKPTTPSVS